MKLSLENLLAGAAVERFDHALAEVVADIRDPNTDPKATRAVTLTLTVKPLGDSREGVVLDLTVKAKRGGLRKVSTTAILDDAGAYTADPRQEDLPLHISPKEGTNDA